MILAAAAARAKKGLIRQIRPAAGPHADNRVMIRLYHFHAGRPAEADPAELPRWRAEPGWIWLDVVGADAATMSTICREFGADPIALNEVLSTTEYPKAYDYPDQTLVVLHGVADDDAMLRTVESDTFIGTGHLVVFRREDLPGYGWVRDQLFQPEHRAPDGPDDLFARFAETGASRFRVLVDAVEAHVEDLEERALGGDPAVIGEVHALLRDALKLRRVLVPQRDTIRRLATEEFVAIRDHARRRLRSALDQYEQAVDTLDTTRALLDTALDTYRAAVAERANEVMKVLTVFAAIVLPLSLVAGIYGMNFGRMPELDWSWGYFAALGVMAAIAVSLWAYFVRRGFIAGPQVARIPRVVGRGLAGMVRLTTRPMVPGRYRPDASDEQQPAG